MNSEQALILLWIILFALGAFGVYLAIRFLTATLFIAAALTFFTIPPLSFVLIILGTVCMFNNPAAPAKKEKQA